MNKEKRKYLHTSYFEREPLINLKDVIYLVLIFLFLFIVVVIIEGVMSLFINSFEIDNESFFVAFSLFLLYMLISDHIRIGFVENLFQEEKEYDNFEFWFDSMEGYLYTEKEAKKSKSTK